MIKSKDGVVLTESSSVKCRWIDYYSEPLNRPPPDVLSLFLSLSLSLSLSSPLSPSLDARILRCEKSSLGLGRGVPPYLSPLGWALFKTRDFHHLKAAQLTCERYGGLGERETVSSGRGRRLVRARQAVAPASRARPQLADWGTAGRYTGAPGPSQVRPTR